MMKPISNRAQLTFVLAAVLLAPLAQAHPGHDATAGFVQGFFHPFTGLDHALAMIAIGLWAAQRGGRAMWAIPAAFVVVMALGGIAGAAGISLPFMEQGVALSVMLLGILVAAAVRWPTSAGVAAAGVFALFHGHMHGIEMPAGASGLTFGAGFVLATALLHVTGIAAAMLARGFDRAILVRVSGAFIAAAGACQLLGV